VRVLAVLVVATPCPLILATPVAVVGGISRAAQRGIVFRTGAAIEQLARISVAVFDKTGTLTIGRPKVAVVLACPPFTPVDVLRLAGGVEQGSSHLLARTLTEEVAARGLDVPEGREITESPGEGVAGRVEGRWVTIGGWSFVVRRYPEAEAGLRAAVAAAAPEASAPTWRWMGGQPASWSSPTGSVPASASSLRRSAPLGCDAHCSSRAMTRPTPPRSGGTSVWTRRTATCCRNRRSHSFSGW
jgi:Cation transport ATPase